MVIEGSEEKVESVKPTLNAFELIGDATSAMRSYWWLLLLPSFVAIAGTVSAIEGNVGDLDDVRYVDDFSAVVFGTEPSGSQSFPLLRDSASLFLFAVIALTYAITHWQWRLMAAALPRLIEAGVVAPGPGSHPPLRVHRLLSPEIVDPAVKPEDRLSRVVQRINDGLARLSRGGNIIMGAALVLALFVVVGEQRSGGVFESLAPTQLSSQQQQEWAHEGYSNWWASTESPLGFVTYVGIAVLGAYAVLVQNIIGCVVVYLLSCLPATSRMTIDWLDTDGRSGWKPAAEIMRTVMLSLCLHALGLSALIIVLGVENFPWMIALVVIWLVVAPIYTVVPVWIFKRLGIAAKRVRLAELRQAESTGSLGSLKEIRDEISYVNSVNINPLRVKPATLLSLCVAFLLPVVLTAAQIWAEVRY